MELKYNGIKTKRIRNTTEKRYNGKTIQRKNDTTENRYNGKTIQRSKNIRGKNGLKMMRFEMDLNCY